MDHPAVTRYKGMSSKGQVTVEDLAELADIHRRLLRMIGSLNHHAPVTRPLMAASATVKAAWAEASGSAMAWSYPGEIPQDGLPRVRAAALGPLEGKPDQE